MELAVLLSVAASFFTATSSVCQRLGARSVKVTGFDPWLVFRLAHQPVWLLGFASMLAGFALQLTALRFGPLAPGSANPGRGAGWCLSSPTWRCCPPCGTPGGCSVRDWLAAVAMSAGTCSASSCVRPRRLADGRTLLGLSLWWLAGLVIAGCVLLAVATATRLSRGGRGSPSDPQSLASPGCSQGSDPRGGDGPRLGIRGRRHQGAQLSYRPGPWRGVRQLGGVCPDGDRDSRDAAGLACAGRRATGGVPARVHDWRPGHRRPARRLPVR